MSRRFSILTVLLCALLWSATLADSSTLVGTWVATRGDGAQTVWTFNADGTMSAEFDGMEGFKGTWTMDTSQVPHPIDILAEGDTIETILEFSDDKKTFRLEIGNADVGMGRPKTFSDGAATFERK